MLFYNITLHCYVVIEIKIRDFELSKIVPEDFKGTLPTIEEIERELK
jgi:hypothetical protein